MSRNLQPQSIATSWLYQITLPDDRDRCEHLLSISCGCCHMTVSSVIYVVVFRLRVKSVTYLQSASHYWFRVSVCHQQVSPALLHRQLLKYYTLIYLCTVFICLLFEFVTHLVRIRIIMVLVVSVQHVFNERSFSTGSLLSS